ncbi:hypothetical protein [Streptosporangium sp. NPDC049046]|uniref:hypothetical protein n=1 Tax=Streptosporangium sp. NPDC049046 TaxID=3155031 RepID=UPI00343D710D
MVRWDCPPRCLSPHVSPVRSHFEELTWHPSHGDGRVRVLRWTCDCEPVFYELCQASGLRFLRRTRRAAPGRASVAESDRWQAQETDEMWIALLHGLVR